MPTQEAVFSSVRFLCLDNVNFFQGELGRQESKEEYVYLKSKSRVILMQEPSSLLCQGQSILLMPHTLTFSSKCICANLMNHQGF